MLDKIDQLRESCKGSIYQSSLWKNALEKDGKNPFTIFIEENNELKASIIAIEQEISTPVGNKKILFSEGTPLFVEGYYGKAILDKFKIESEKYFYGLIRPTVINSSDEVFFATGYRKVSDSTILIDLSKTDDELWQKLEKKSARWGVKTAEKNGLRVEEAKNDNEIKEFYAMYEKTTKDGGFRAKSLQFINEIIKNKSGKLFIVKKGEKIVAGGLILIDFNYNILNITSANEEGYRLQAMPFLYWNLILTSKKMGKKFFDLGGYDKNVKPGSKIYNINKFKENFGGNIVEQAHYATNWKYPLARKAMNKFGVIRRIYKKK